MDKQLQWGNRKRSRCAKVKSSSLNRKSGGGGANKKFAPRAGGNHGDYASRDGNSAPSLPYPRRPGREIGLTANDTVRPSTSSSEDKHYTKKGGSSGSGDGGDGGGSGWAFENPKEECGTKIVWPRLLITLSSKEKGEDFMAIKGCKPPQRPKKRAKLIQRTILLVSPGTWLMDLCQERYEVREKKTSKKKPRGLKAMGSTGSDSEW